MRHWQMQEAKAKLSEVIKEAEKKGPQKITVHGRPVAVVLSREDYERLIGACESLAAFMRDSPLFEAEDVALERDEGLTREVEL